jgi:hypothetical protein
MYNTNEYNSNFSFQNAIPCLADCELYFKQICILDNKVIQTLMGYLEYNDIINLKLSSKSTFKKIDRKILKKFIRSGGITKNTRRIFWLNNIDYQSMKEIIKKELQINENNVYYKLYELSENEKQNTNFFKICDEINRDLYRTFYEGKFTTQEGQEELGRVLQAIAFVRPEIGYCQGMNFVAGALSYFMENEELTFWIFLSMLDYFEMNSLYFKVSIYLYRICRIIVLEYFN